MEPGPLAVLTLGVGMLVGMVLSALLSAQLHATDRLAVRAQRARGDAAVMLARSLAAYLATIANRGAPDVLMIPETRAEAERLVEETGRALAALEDDT